MSGRYTHSHPCMQHSTQNTELWTCTNTQNSIGGPTEVLYCARMLLKFQCIASASQVCFFAKLAPPPCKNKWKQHSLLPQWHMDLLFRANHGAAKPSRPVSGAPHLITFSHPDSSIDIFLITSQNGGELNSLRSVFFPVFSKMMTSNTAREYSVQPDGSRTNLLFNVLL